MIGLILITHAGIGEDFIKALEHVHGAPQRNIIAISVTDDKKILSYQKDLQQAANRLNQGQGVIVLTDVYGSTPANMTRVICGMPDVEIIHGINLPMLVKLAELRQQPTSENNLHTIAVTARNAAKKNIHLSSEKMTEKKDHA